MLIVDEDQDNIAYIPIVECEDIWYGVVDEDWDKLPCVVHWGDRCWWLISDEDEDG